MHKYNVYDAFRKFRGSELFNIYELLHLSLVKDNKIVPLYKGKIISLSSDNRMAIVTELKLDRNYVKQ